MTPKPDSVRVATPRDEAAVYALLVDLHRNNKAGWGFPFSPQTVMAQIETATRPDQRTRTNPNDPRHGIIGIIDGRDNTLVGSVGLFDQPPMWFSDGTPARALFEIWLYVRPRARHSGRHYRDLFRFSKWAHDAMKADLAKTDYPYQFTLFTGFMQVSGRYALMDRLWQMFSGGIRVGSLYMRR